MNFLILPGERELRRVDFETRDVFIDRGPGKSGVAVQLVGFSHPELGAHGVYVDKRELDAAGIPRPALYEAIAILVERAVTN